MLKPDPSSILEKKRKGLTPDRVKKIVKKKYGIKELVSPHILFDLKDKEGRVVSYMEFVPAFHLIVDMSTNSLISGHYRKKIFPLLLFR